MTAKPSLLVLCTGNSARSQMAAAFLEQHAGERYRVFSAGTEPAERVHPLTVEVMREKGIDLSGKRPVSVDELLKHEEIDTLITVCDGAAQSCPTVPGVRRRLPWPFDDPAAFEGSGEAKLAEFRRIRDQVEARVIEWSAGD